MAQPGPGVNAAQRTARWLLLTLGLLASLALLYRIRTTLFLLGISFFLAYLLDPLVDRMEQRRVPRTVAIFMLLFALVGSLVLLFWVVVPQVQLQIQHAVERAPGWGQWLSERLTPLLERLQIRMDREALREYTAQLWDWVSQNLPQVIKPVLQTFQQMFTGLANFIVGILNIIIIPVLTFYLLKDFDRIRDRFYAALPPPWQAAASRWLEDLDQAVGGFVRGQFTIALILSILYAVGLSLMGVPMGALLGVISGMANMVPYMAPIVGLLPAMILAFLDEPNWWRLLWILALYIGGQLLEGVYLGPRIMGKETGLHPVLVMVAIMIGGTLMGLIGIILAVPVAAVLRVVVLRWHERWLQRWREPAPETGRRALPATQNTGTKP